MDKELNCFSAFTFINFEAIILAKVVCRVSDQKVSVQSVCILFWVIEQGTHGFLLLWSSYSNYDAD
jgi:hypothetical protein